MGAAPILTILKNGETVRTFPVEREAVVGRGEGCVVRLEDRAISRQHAVIRPAPGGLQVERKSPFAPLIVNGAECTVAIVKEGDVISMGPYLMKVSVPKGGSLDPARNPAPSMAATSGLAEPTAVLDSGETGDPASQAPVSLDTPGSPGSLTEALSPSTQEHSPTGSAAETGAEAGASPESPEVSEEPLDLQSPWAGGGIQLEAPSSGSGDLQVVGEPAELPPYEPTAGVELASDTAATISAQEKLSYQLVIPAGKANHQNFPIQKDQVSIGRGKDCDIILDDKRASRVNSVIERRGSGYVIRDLKSANGTYVNGVRIEEQELSGDDRLRIGDVELRFGAVNLTFLAREKNFLQPDQSRDQARTGSQAPGPSILSLAPGQGLTGMHRFEAGQPDSRGASVSGIAGVRAAGVPKSLKEALERFRGDPNFRRKVLIYIAAGFAVLNMLDSDPPAGKKQSTLSQATQVAPGGSSAAAPKPGASAQPAAVSLASLSSEQQREIQAWHDLAFNYYRNKEYDRALFELQKIFALVPDFQQAREIERYATEGKRRNQLAEEEKRKKQEAERNRVRVAQLEDEVSERMKKQQYAQARELFSEILMLDPDNTKVAEWQKTLQREAELRQMAEQEREIRREARRRTREMLDQAKQLMAQERFQEASAAAQRAALMGQGSPKLVNEAQELADLALQSLREKRTPLFEEGMRLEHSGDLAGAFRNYEQARRIDPEFVEALEAMNRIRGSLHEKAKLLYIEAVLAESYSDFATAKRKFKEALDSAPAGDEYHERAQRKLARYFEHEQPEGTGP